MKDVTETLKSSASWVYVRELLCSLSESPTPKHTSKTEFVVETQRVRARWESHPCGS